MIEARNVTKERLEAGKVAFGVAIRFSRSVSIARMAATSGYHYLFIDLEHSTMSLDFAAELSAACLDAGVTPMIRAPGHDHHHMTRLLDCGAQAIVAPHVENAAEARAIVANIKSPPVGHRSGAGTPIQLGWRRMPGEELSAKLNDNVLLVAMVESRAALEEVEKIAAVDGVDVISLGGTDLTLDLGIPGQFEHPTMLAAYRRVGEAVRKHGKHLRIAGFEDPRLIHKAIALGSRVVTLATDTYLLVDGMRAKMAAVLDGLEEPRLAE